MTVNSSRWTLPSQRDPAARRASRLLVVAPLLTSMLGLLVAGSGAQLMGCSSCDTRGGDPVVFSDGIVSDDGRLYESTVVDAEMLHFPAGRIYDIEHGMGVVPTSVKGYVSLSSQLTADGDPYDLNHPNNVTEVAGNQMVIERWDDEVIRIRNDTCAEWYVRVVAIADGGASPPAGTAGATGN